jgi:hypothetical protein
MVVLLSARLGKFPFSGDQGQTKDFTSKFHPNRRGVEGLEGHDGFSRRNPSEGSRVWRAREGGLTWGRNFF